MRQTSFNGITLRENDGSLCLGTDSLLCAAYMRSHSRDRGVELGCGSGVISLLLLSRDKIGSVCGLEIDEHSARLCAENINCNGLSDRMTVKREDIRLLSPAEHQGISVVYANPPYMRVGAGKECLSPSAENARHEHSGGIEEFCRAASRILKTGGCFYAVYRPDRLSALMRALAEYRLSPKRMTFVHSDPFHAASSVLVEARKDGGESLYLTPPLLLNRDGRETEELSEIYASGFFPKKYYAP